MGSGVEGIKVSGREGLELWVGLLGGFLGIVEGWRLSIWVVC